MNKGHEPKRQPADSLTSDNQKSSVAAGDTVPFAWSGLPKYLVSRTLIGGEPDCNTRFIRERDTGDLVAEFKADPDGWSFANQQAIDARLRELT